MFRHFVGALSKPIIKHSNAYMPEEKRTFEKRLKAIAYDLLSIPKRFCDAIDEDAVENALMIDTTFDHVIDQRMLERLLADGTYHEHQEGKYINPHDMDRVILTPQTFSKATQKTQYQLMRVLERILQLDEKPIAQKNNFVLEMLDIQTQLTGYQAKLITGAIELFFDHTPNQEEKQNSWIKSEKKLTKSTTTYADLLSKNQKDTNKNNYSINSSMLTFPILNVYMHFVANYKY